VLGQRECVACCDGGPQLHFALLRLDCLQAYLIQQALTLYPAYPTSTAVAASTSIC
jgi:hypothetical protein